MEDGGIREKFSAKDLSWKTGEQFDDVSGEWQTKLRASSTRVFKDRVNGLKDWVEVQRIDRRSRYLIASTGSDTEKIRLWGPRSTDSFKQVECDGLPENWELFDCRNITKSCEGINSLTISSFTRVLLVGGIKSGGRNSYFDFAKPQVLIENGTGEELVKINGFEALKPKNNNEWIIPDNIETGRPLRLEVTRGDESIARKFLRFDFFDSLPDFENTPYRNSTGDVINQFSGGPLAQGAFVKGFENTNDFKFQLPFYLSHRLFFIGPIPGQVVDWPSEDIAQDWEPVWAIAIINRKKWEVHYVGASFVQPNFSLSKDRKYDIKDIKKWKEITYNKRKITDQPKMRLFKELWAQYKEQGRNAK